MSVKARDLQLLMKKYGFSLVRQSKHSIWSDGTSQVAVSGTPSDNYALIQIERDLKRAVRRTMESKKAVS